MNTSQLVFKKELLMNQNSKLQEECSLLKEQFVILKKKISQRQLAPLETTEISRKNLETALKKLEMYKAEYESLSKLVQSREQNSSSSALELEIKNHQSSLKLHEKENYRLNQILSKSSEPKPQEPDLLCEKLSLTSSISKLEQTLSLNVSSISQKNTKISELESELHHLKHQVPDSNKHEAFKNPLEAKRYYRNLKKSLNTNLTKYIQLINQLEDTLNELKKQEIILKSTLIKKQQQLRLISMVDKSMLNESLSEEKTVPDVKFFYKPTIKYLYT